MNWANITEFNFTYAVPDGAWLKDAEGNCEWVHYSQIEKELGKAFWDAGLRKQGMFTGCWVKV